MPDPHDAVYQQIREPQEPEKATKKLQNRLESWAGSGFLEDLFGVAKGPVEFKAGDVTHALAETSQVADVVTLASSLYNAPAEELRRVMTGEIGQTVWKRREQYGDEMRWALEGIHADPHARAPFERITGMGLDPGAEAVREATEYGLEQLRGTTAPGAVPPAGGMLLARLFDEMEEGPVFEAMGRPTPESAAKRRQALLKEAMGNKRRK
jgi:hypothetical protein